MNNTSALYETIGLYDTFKIICKNTLHVITFGMYREYTDSKIMELNNDNISGNIMCEEMDENKIKKKELVEQLIR